ncbi:S-layer homology domain-containing protein [Patescibacteria group bacterium]
MKKFVSVLIALTLCFLQFPTTSAMVSNEVIYSTVQINTYNLYEDSLLWMGSGSGTIISEDGIILTNMHVLVDEELNFNDFIEICYTVSEFEAPICLEEAYVLAYDESFDLALIYPYYRYDPESDMFYELQEEDHYGYPPVTFSTTAWDIQDLPNLRDDLSIIGYPGASLSENITVTNGVVTGFQSISAETLYQEVGIENMTPEEQEIADMLGDTIVFAIETDALINPGNSGGTAIDALDRFIGIPTYVSIYGEAGQYGYIIPVHIINIWLDSLVEEGILNFNPNEYVYGETQSAIEDTIYSEISQTEGTDITGFSKQLFLDLDESHPNYLAIKFLKENKIIGGYLDGTFLPEGEITRAELMKILVLSTGIQIDVEKYNNCFPDVLDDWYAKYVCYAKEQGWVQGYDDGTFKPGNKVVKAEAIKMVINTQGVILDQVGTIKPYNDVELNEWFAPYVVTAKNLGILEEEGILYKPGDNATRGGVSENIYRVIRN